MTEEMAKMVLIGFTKAFGAGAFDVGDEWNGLLPDYEFTDVRTFLREAWKGKP